MAGFESLSGESFDRVPIETSSTVLASIEHPNYSADRALVKELCGGRSGVVAVFDGLGEGGEMSAQAAEACQRNLAQEASNLLEPPTINEASAILKRALAKSGEEIGQLRSVSKDDQVDTTASAGLVCESLDKARRFMVIANVGDSRMYKYRPSTGEVSQLTTDHSLVESLVKQGLITREEAFFHPQRNGIFRAVGSLNTPDGIDISVDEIQDGDIYLAVSDGVSDNLTPRGLPIAVQDSYRESFNPQENTVDLKDFSKKVAVRAQNISNSSTARQAKSDDITVAVLKLPRQA